MKAACTRTREERGQPRGNMLTVPAAMTKKARLTRPTLSPRGQPGHHRVPGGPRSARTSRGGPEPQAGPAGTHPTATRRQRRAGCTMRASQAAASRPSGDRGPGGTGAGPSLSELQSERSAVPGSSGSSKNTQPTASARKPAHADPRHSAIWTHRRTGSYRILSRLAPPPSWARDDVDARNVTPARHRLFLPVGGATAKLQAPPPELWVELWVGWRRGDNGAGLGDSLCSHRGSGAGRCCCAVLTLYEQRQ